MGKLIQRVSTELTAATGITGNFPADGSVPQKGEGTQILSVNITPTNASNKIVSRVVAVGENSTGATHSLAVFKGSGDTVGFFYGNTLGGIGRTVAFGICEFTAGVTSQLTMTVEAGSGGGTWTLNEATYQGGQRCFLEVSEIEV